MKFKSLIALFCVVLALVAWLRFFEKNFKDSADTHLLHIEPLKVTTIIIAEGNNTFSLNRCPAGWMLSTSPEDRADDEQVSRLLALASALKPFDSIYAKELKTKRSLAEFGLLSPRRSLTFRQEGKPDQVLYFGNEAVGEKSVFAKAKHEKNIVMISSALSDQAFRPQDDFRDHLLTALSLEDLQSIQLHQPLGDLSLLWNDDHWHMSQPIDSAVNELAIQNWITPLLQAPIMARFADDEANLTRYGLDQPRAKITLSQHSNQPSLHLWLGNKSSAEEPSSAPAIYVRSSERKSIFKISAAFEKIFMISPDLLKDQQLFSVNLDTVDKITITKKETTISLKHQLGGGDGWVTEGNNATFILGSDIQRFVDALQKIEVLNIEKSTPTNLQELGLASPAEALASVRFTAHLSENTPDHDAGDYVVSEILFGTPQNAPNSKLYVRVNNTPDLRQVPLDSLEKINLPISKK